MQRITTFALAVSLAVGSAWATEPVTLTMASTKAETAVKAASTLVSRQQLAQGVNLDIRRDAQGRLFKQLTGSKVRAAKAQAKKPAMRATSADLPINEDFETYDGTTKGWFPEGWSNVSHTSDSSRAACEAQNMYLGWEVTAGSPVASPLQGKADLYISLQFTPTDEWLMLPPVDVKEGFKLSYIYNIDDIFLYDMSNLDFETWSFKGDPKQTYDILVKASTDGGQTWDVLKSYFETSLASGDTPLDMLSAAGATRTEEINLDKYAGKRVQLALQYVGTNGQSNQVDVFKVGMPPIEVSYQSPASTKFLGINTGFLGMSNPIAVYPVFSPVTWTNTSAATDGASYFWEYMDNDSNMRQTSDEALSVTYTPDYKSETTIRSNWFYLPTLHGTAPGWSEGTFTAPYKYLQAGGKGEYKNGDTLLDLGLLPFCAASDGNTTYRIGADAPLAGYGCKADSSWTQWYKSDGYAAVAQKAVYNVYPSPTAPMTLSGVRVMVTGKVNPEATFTLRLSHADNPDKVTGAEGKFSFVEATATAKGSDIIETTSGSTYNWLCIPFKFDQPVALTNGVHPYYVISFSGFDDPANVEYLACYQSKTPSADNMAFGAIQMEAVDSLGNKTYIAERAGSLTGAAGQAFCFVEDAVYPWLVAPEVVEINSQAPVTIPFESYYDASDLRLVGLLPADATHQADGWLPDWLTATIDGRYNNARLTLTSTKDDAEDVQLALVSPGQQRLITVKNMTAAGIADIAADQASAVTGYYDLQGRRIARPVQGQVCIERRADGTAAKVVR